MDRTSERSFERPPEGSLWNSPQEARLAKEVNQKEIEEQQKRYDKPKKTPEITEWHSTPALETKKLEEAQRRKAEEAWKLLGKKGKYKKH